MKLQTNINIKKEENNQIDFNSEILLLGSCFSENIGNKLKYFKFQATQNPFGILFHPKAIENLIENAINDKKFTEKDLIFHNQLWHCFDAHSALSNIDKNEVLNELNAQISNTKTTIENASHIIITLGTSWVYRFTESNKVVANCHKIPQQKFSKEILSVEAVTKSLHSIISLIKTVNNNSTIIFTLSPVRHLKDGFIENMQSKAHLISAIHQVLDKHVKYFPSYEIMMDELRDYRFYEEDMIHPNTIAINYIWEKFSTTWCSEKTLEIMKEVDTIQKGMQHKPFHPNSEEHLKFLKKLSLKKKQLQQKIKHISF